MVARDQLYHLIDLLPEEEYPMAQRFLEFLLGEGEDEPLTEEDWKAVREGEAAIARGEFTTLRDVKRELDL